LKRNSERLNIKKEKQFLLVIGVSLCIITSSFILLRATVKMSVKEENYLLDNKIPGIVEGTAKMVDTEKYFTINSIKASTIKLNIVCNNSDYLEISVGYKSPTYSLLSANNPEKEITLWSGSNKFPTKNVDRSYFDGSKESSLKNKVIMEWDLLSIGFRPEEYLKADERIWFLRIKDIREGPYGYNEIKDSVVYNGTRYTQTDYHPNMNYLDTFQLVFNGLVFETLFHPVFDGSTEIIVPIRGVNHELTNKNRQTEDSNEYNVNIINPNPLGNLYLSSNIDHWAVVFATAEYDTSTVPDASYMPVEGCAFILGLDAGHGYDPWATTGILDYGWSVIYCMDQMSDGEHPLCTTEKTDDDHLKYMLTYVASHTSSNDEVIVFVNCHGSEYNGLNNQHGPHRTVTGKSSFNIFYGCSDTMTASAYKDYISDITDDDKYVFLWIDCCHGDGLNTVSDWQGYHNKHLRVWAYDPTSYNDGYPLNVDYDDDNNPFHWAHWIDTDGDSEAWTFFEYSYNNLNLDYIGNKAQQDFNEIFTDSKMFIVDCFDGHKLVVNFQ
jgi:hypothetical protein